MEQRQKLALELIDTHKDGLELGPLYSPLVPKAGTNIAYIDHMSAADLKKKYQFAEPEASQVVDVDYVLGNKTLAEVLQGRQFDYVVASHVIEHLADMVRWLQDIAAVLKPGGLLSLVIPDKRYTFDITRNVSRPADVVGAYLDKLTKPSAATIFDYISQVRGEVVAHEVWQNPANNFSAKPRLYSLQEAYDTAVQNLDPEQYVDCHVTVFTPNSFIELAKTLIELDLFDYEIASFTSTPENQLEFYTTLRQSNASKAIKLASLPHVPSSPEPWEFEAKLADAQATLDKVIGSRSWKLTKPLRDLKTRLKS